MIYRETVKVLRIDDENIVRGVFLWYFEER
jgi:hypothetical protein